MNLWGDGSDILGYSLVLWLDIVGFLTLAMVHDEVKYLVKLLQLKLANIEELLGWSVCRYRIGLMVLPWLWHLLKRDVVSVSDSVAILVKLLRYFAS